MIFIEVVLGLTWFCLGISGPVASCVRTGDMSIEDMWMIPISGLIGPISLLVVLGSYYRMKGRS